ncbi:hypothetical protein H1R20_g5555, partial [Candolleomyces eurysporus]
MARSGSIPKRLEVVPVKREKEVEEEEQEDEDADETEDKDQAEDQDEDQDEGEEEGQDDDDEEEEDHREEEKDDQDMELEEQNDKQEGRQKEDKNVQPNEDVLAQLLTDGVPLNHFGVVFSDPEDLKILMDSLGDPDTSAKPRPWDGIQSLGLAFTDDCRSDEPNVLESLLLHLPDTITSFELRLTDSYAISEDESDFLFHEPILHLPEHFAGRLTSFSISCDWGAQHMFTLLEHCVNLEVVTLDFKVMEGLWTIEYTDYLQTGHLPRIKLPKLHTLCLRGVPPDVVDILWYLEAPALANLDFEFVDDGLFEDDGFDYALLAFLTTQSKCAATLKSFRLAGPLKLNPKGLCIILDELPALTYLGLDNVSFNDGEDLFQALKERCTGFSPGRIRRDPEPFLPSLRVLEIIGQFEDDNFHHLSRFVTSREHTLRSQDDGRLKELVVAYSKPPSPLDLDSWERKVLNKSATVVNIHPLR